MAQTIDVSYNNPEQTAQVRHRYMTFHRLARAGAAELEKIFTRGVTPEFHELENWEFRGWNVGSVTKLLGFQKFKKGFYRQPGSHREGEIYGYNVVVRQNAIHEPHLALPNELEPKKHGYYLVSPVDIGKRDNLYPNALLLDYSEGPDNPMYDPSSLLRDYLVKVEPENSDLFLGKAYFAIGLVRVFAGFFVLERYNKQGR